MIRAFIAIELPDDVRAAIGDVQDRLKRAHLGVKVSWVKIENIHLTLQFLGSIDDSRVEAIAVQCEKVAAKFSPFTLELEGTGTFPAGGNPRVVWVGVKESGSLAGLQAEIGGKMEGLDFVREERPFLPHLTLGRVKSLNGKNELIRKIEEGRGFKPGDLRVDRFHLFRSELFPQGAVYTKLRAFMLNL